MIMILNIKLHKSQTSRRGTRPCFVYVERIVVRFVMHHSYYYDTTELLLYCCLLYNCSVPRSSFRSPREDPSLPHGSSRPSLPWDRPLQKGRFRHKSRSHRPADREEPAPESRSALLAQPARSAFRIVTAVEKDRRRTHEFRRVLVCTTRGRFLFSFDFFF